MTSFIKDNWDDEDEEKEKGTANATTAPAKSKKKKLADKIAEKEVSVIFTVVAVCKDFYMIDYTYENKPAHWICQ